MGEKERLLKQHKELYEFSFTAEQVELFKRHILEEEAFFEKNAERLGGKDDLSPVGMALKEHKLLLELLEKGEKDLFKELLHYHLVKEENQIYTLLE